MTRWRRHHLIGVVFLGMAVMPAAKGLGDLATIPVATDLEYCEKWLEAARRYEQQASEDLESANHFMAEAQRCRFQHRLRQLCHAPAFLQFASQLQITQAGALYSGAVRQLQDHALEPPTLIQLWQLGLRDLRWAILNPAFLRTAFVCDPTPILQQELNRQMESLFVENPTSPASAARDLQRLLSHCQLHFSARPGFIAAVFYLAAGSAPDERCAYLLPHWWEKESGAKDLQGEVGLILAARDCHPVVVKVLVESPAERLGIQSGDELLSVDEVPSGSFTVDELGLQLRGRPGSRVSLAWRRPNDSFLKHKILVRDVVPGQVLRSKYLDCSGVGIGHVQIHELLEETSSEFDKAWEGLRRLGVRAAILDLRGQCGGNVAAAADLASRFLKPASTVCIVHRRNTNPEVYRSTSFPSVTVPLVVLVDSRTASAAEVIAASLTEHGRCILVGQRTFGKGTLQQLVPLGQGQGGFRLTTGRWLCPSGRNVDRVGLMPAHQADAEAQLTLAIQLVLAQLAAEGVAAETR